MTISKAEYRMVALLGRVAYGRLPISSHAMVRLKERRKDVTFEEAITDVVHAWTEGIDMSIDDFHLEILNNLVKAKDLKVFRYILYKQHLYIFDRMRVLVTIMHLNRDTVSQEDL